MRIRCADIDVEVREWGRGLPLVMAHGIGEDHRAWRFLLPHLALDFHVIAYDVRGHGQTSLGGADGTLRQLGDDLIALLDALGLERADLCGFSLGGTIVMRAAITAPDRVRRLMPVATSSRVGRDAAVWYEQRAELADQGIGALHPVLDADTREMLIDTPELVGGHIRLRYQATADPAGFANACRAMAGIRTSPLDSELSQISAPTLVVAGELDQLCPPRAAEVIAAAIESGDRHVIPAAGHHIPLQHPAELARLAHGFLEPYA